MPVRVSVVTPFHNTEQYLEECISSVLAQSFRDFEYLLVNNCSTDRSREIAARFAAQDSRIRLIDNPGLLEQVPNYNHALAQISPMSRYCKLVQADDWIYPGCLREMVALADSDESIGIVSSYRLVGKGLSGVGLPASRAGTGVHSGRDVCRLQLLQDRFFFGSPTTVLFRADIVRARTPFYALGRLHEDTEACYEILRDWSFGFVHQVLSFTRIDNESIMSSARRFNSDILDKLINVRLFGANYLDERESERCWRSHERRYLRFLAGAKLRFRGAAFWQYHRRGSATIGYRLPMLRIYGYLVWLLVDIVLNPKRTLERCWCAIRHRFVPARER